MSGIPKPEAECIHDAVHKLADKLKVSYNRYDIVAAHKFPAKKSIVLPIIVWFVNYVSKSNWLKVSKKGLAPSNLIYCDEHLTERNNGQVKAAKDLKKANLVVQFAGREMEQWRSGWMKEAQLFVFGANGIWKIFGNGCSLTHLGMDILDPKEALTTIRWIISNNPTLQWNVPDPNLVLGIKPYYNSYLIKWWQRIGMLIAHALIGVE